MDGPSELVPASEPPAALSGPAIQERSPAPIPSPVPAVTAPPEVASPASVPAPKAISPVSTSTTVSVPVQPAALRVPPTGPFVPTKPDAETERRPPLVKRRSRSPPTGPRHHALAQANRDAAHASHSGPYLPLKPEWGRRGTQQQQPGKAEAPSPLSSQPEAAPEPPGFIPTIPQYKPPKSITAEIEVEVRPCQRPAQQALTSVLFLTARPAPFTQGSLGTGIQHDREVGEKSGKRAHDHGCRPQGRRDATRHDLLASRESPGRHARDRLCRAGLSILMAHLCRFPASPGRIMGEDIKTIVA